MLVGKITCGLYFSEINIIKKTAIGRNSYSITTYGANMKQKSSERMFEFKLLLMVYIIV